MGIPAFYRWLLERYPRSVEAAVEAAPAVVNGVIVPIDTTAPNPNGYEFDNLYLDMNGIVHPCFHPEGLPPPETYDEVFMAIFKYIDRVFSIIRPRKLLFMAIDGVAPRAKMNQQRARRFRAAKDAAAAASGTENMRGINESKGEDPDTTQLDSNVITPGTEFMALLSSALQYYVRIRMNEDPGWQGIKVILSDASVPGEGEHKIVSYIRLQRNLQGFDPNTRHCLYGLDADLIMLALATHEVHFAILREDVRKAQSKDRGLKHGKPVQVAECSNKLENFISEQKFQILRIWVLRDYLAHDLQIPNSAIKVDLERLIDDFVFICLFVGNDFLPHMPSLEISEGAIDLLMNVYKKEFVQMGGYLTNSVEVNLKRVEHFIRAVGSYENKIFKKRIQARKQWERPNRHHSTNQSDPKGNQNKNLASYKTDLEDDKVKLGEEGWKDRYYAEKFEVETVEDCETVRRNTVLKYAEGICWVMHYYYQGVCSWQWFYPYHYAPFASDFHGFDNFDITFTLGKPFRPFDQLMGVLPAASAQALPLSYRKLMTDPLSPILDFYPPDFELDINGKRHSWQAVCKLPFIEEFRLLSEIAKLESTLTDGEKKRNSLGLDMLFVHESYPLAEKILSFYERNKNNPKLANTKVKRKINPNFSQGMNGYIYISDKPVCPEEVHSPINDMGLIINNKVICVFYKVPAFHPHISRLPDGVILPIKAINKKDILPPPLLWHEATAITKGRHTIRPMPRKSVSGSRLARIAHRLVLENLIVKPQENGVHKAHLTNQTCPDNLIAKQQENGVHKAHLTNQTCPDNLIVKQQENGVHMEVQSNLTNQTCLDKEYLDECRKMKRADARKKRRQRKKLKKNMMPMEAHFTNKTCPDNLIVKQQENGVHMEVLPNLTNQTCPDNLIVKQQENGVHMEMLPNMTNQTCPDNLIAKQQENGVHMEVIPNLINQTCPDNLIVKQQENGVHMEVQPNSTNQTCPDNLIAKQQENEVHMEVQPNLTNQTCPDNLIVNQQENGVHMEVQSNLTNQTCLDKDYLDECRKRKRADFRRKRRQRKKLEKNTMTVQAHLTNQTCPDNLTVKQQENQVHNAVQAHLTNQTCPDNLTVKQQEDGVHSTVHPHLTNQTCPDNLIVKQQENGVHMEVQPNLTNRTCPDYLSVKQQEDGVHSAMQAHLTNQTCLEKFTVKQQEDGVHSAVQAHLTNQTCPEKLTVKQKEDGVHSAVQAHLTNQTCPDNLTVKQQENGVHMEVQPNLTNQTCPDNLIVKQQENGVLMEVQPNLTNQTFPDNLTVKQQENRVHMEVQPNLTNQTCPDNLIVKQQENGVHIEVQSNLTNQTCPDKEYLDECRKRKRADGRRMRRQRKKLEKTTMAMNCNPSSAVG